MASVLGASTTRHGAAPPAESIREKVRAFAEANQPEGENAWPLIEKAIAQLEAIKREFTPSDAIVWSAIFDRDFMVGIPIDEQSLRDTPTALARAKEAGVHEQVIRAARSGRLLLPRREEGLVSSAYIGATTQLRELSRFMLAVLVDAIDRGDSELAVAAFDAAMFLGSRASEHPGLLQMLVGMAIQSQALSVLQHELISGRPITEKMLRGWLAAIDARPLRHGRDHLRMEVEFLLVDVGVVFNEEGVIPPEHQAEILELLELGGTIDMLAFFAKLDAEEDEERAEVPEEIARQFPTRETFEQWMRTTVDRVEALLQEPPVRWVPVEPILADGHLFSKLMRAFADTFTIAARRHVQRESYRHAMRVMISVELYRQEHGHYPDDLAALARTPLTTVPRDPYTGGSFGYRREVGEGGDESYILYSFGANNTDNRGTPCERPGRAWSMAHGDPECDFVFNRPWFD